MELFPFSIRYLKYVIHTSLTVLNGGLYNILFSGTLVKMWCLSYLCSYNLEEHSNFALIPGVKNVGSSNPWFQEDEILWYLGLRRWDILIPRTKKTRITGTYPYLSFGPGRWDPLTPSAKRMRSPDTWTKNVRIPDPSKGREYEDSCVFYRHIIILFYTVPLS